MHIADVLSGRAKLIGVQSLLCSPTARKVLRDELRTLLPKGTLLGPCHLREVRFKPGRKLTAYLDVVVRGGAIGVTERYCVRPIAVSWGLNIDTEPHKEKVDFAQMQAEAVRRGVAAPFLQLMGDSPEWNMQVRVAPLDARFTQLVRLSDPQHVRAILADTYASGNAASDQRRGRDYTVKFVKYRTGIRHVLRYDPVGQAKAEAVFAKLYIGEEGKRTSGAYSLGMPNHYRREDGARAFRVAQGVANWLAEQGRGMNGLRPQAYVAEDAVVLYPRLCGVPLSDCARRPNGVVAQCLQQAGAALSIVHQLPEAFVGPLGPPRDFAAEIRSIGRKSDHIPALFPQVESAIEALLDRARELHERLPQEPPTFTHGDLKTEHIWVTAGGLTVMDFDSSRPADPAHDVGYFLADWQFQQAVYDPASVDEIYERFFAGYGPGMPEERVLRAHVYEAVELVKCAVRRTQLFERDWESRMVGLIARAEAVLNDVQRKLGFPERRLLSTSASLTHLTFGELDSRTGERC